MGPFDARLQAMLNRERKAYIMGQATRHDGPMWPAYPNTPALHKFQTQVKPGDRRASHFRPQRQRNQKFGRKLNCYQRGHGGNGEVKVWRIAPNGARYIEVDC